MFPILTQELFEKLREFIYHETAISLNERKFSLVQSRLQRRLKALGLESFDAYYMHISNARNNDEIALLIDAISTNVTSFFREETQWVFLKEHREKLLDWYKSKGKLRIWSAACSSGQEPYSIAIFLLENMRDAAHMDIKILASDISGDILRQAMEGLYSEKEIGNMSPLYKKKYFIREKTGEEVRYRISPQVKKMVLFRQFNLTRGDFLMFAKTDLDMVFCRNVMIYFDAPTKKELFQNFHKILHPGKLFFLGHSESMMGDMLKQFKMQRPSIYIRL